ncbi:staphylococcal nuclease domain-containing protein 1 [Neodiprion fabricii]|uniref:staphylococcal nuclease domain-containing protein 1 n=1 Tax=Neodiprion fabricii TaxID=2872261 RepID=UPI001ED8DF5E|nr:staphylococcal nuclease domain-containing protein 1 [Neodiprion fabricii]
MSTAAPQVQTKHGIVKQVNSGDSIIIRGQPKGGPPPEKQLILSNVTAPKLARRAYNNADETKDEPYAWEAREFLRKKLIGQEVIFTSEKPPNATREYGVVWLGKDTTTGENITESLVSEGLVTVRREGVRNVTPELARLHELEDAAKAAGKGKWAGTPSSEHVRDIKWNIENPRSLVDKLGGKPVKAVIEHVRDGSTVRAFLIPDFYHITLMISGIRCPGFKLEEGKPVHSVVVPFAEEARYFVESRLLQRDVEIVLESVNNNNFVGSILHPKGNIAEALLREGFARCVDWSMAFMKSGADKLYLAEKSAKENRLRIWKDYVPSGPQISGKEREYTATVVEIAAGDALIVKTPCGTTKKVFLSSIRPPRGPVGEDGKAASRPKDFRQLYDIPWMFEAREFLRKKLIGKQVKVVVDYIQPARESYPEKICCTITIGKINVAEAMVSKGLATVLRYRQDDDQRSSHYNDLLAAESKAIKSLAGVHGKEKILAHRITDVAGDVIKAKRYLPHLQRSRNEAIVEFVTSGSRLRLYLGKESCLITFLLAGINAPRGPRPVPGGGGIIEGAPFGEEALNFTKERCLQREVEIQVISMDAKGGNFIGWLWIEGVNLSVALVKAGLASVHPTAEHTEFYRELIVAEERAKEAQLKIWKDYVEAEVETEKPEEEVQTGERKVDYQKVVVTEVTEELHFFAQNVDQGDVLEGLLSRMRQELAANPPLPGAYNPKRGDLAVAKFTEDDQWYRAKVEKVSGPNVSVFYIDYGNRETLNVTRVAAMPGSFATDKPFATEYVLAYVTLPNDNDYKKLAIEMLQQDTAGKPLLLNIEYKVNNLAAATLVDATTKEDVARGLILDGFLLVENRREKRLAKFIADYQAAQQDAKKSHRNIWEYGDITEDDAREFGVGR